jgi:hypothetical protein
MNSISFEKDYYDEIEPQKIVLLMDTTYFGREY